MSGDVVRLGGGDGAEPWEGDPRLQALIAEAFAESEARRRDGTCAGCGGPRSPAAARCTACAGRCRRNPRVEAVVEDLVEWHLQGVSYREMGARLGTSGSVARHALRRWLGPRADEPDVVLGYMIPADHRRQVRPFIPRRGRG
jgi:hypothetical protein